MQAPGNHQVQNQPEIALHSECDSLSDPAQFLNGASFHPLERRGHATQQKWIAQAHPLELLPKHARFECGDVSGDIGQFWHGLSLHATRALCNRVSNRVRTSFEIELMRIFCTSAIDSRG